MDRYDALFLIGLAALEVGLWLVSAAVALVAGGVILMTISIVIPARLAARTPTEEAKE